MLFTLRALGKKVYLLSNAQRVFTEYEMRYLDIEHFFDVVVLSDDIGVNKPDRRIFDHALKKAGAKAETSVIIGDNPDTDIAGAIAAGWNAIYFNPENKDFPDTIKDACVVSHLKEVRDLL